MKLKKEKIAILVAFYFYRKLVNQLKLFEIFLFLIYNILDLIGVHMTKLAERLKELRMEKGLSIQALARATGIGSSSICRWENEQADIKGEQLVILAKFFDVTIDYLMGLED